MRSYEIYLLEPHGRQQAILDNPAKRKIIRAGRRSGKTIVASIDATKLFLGGKRILYGAPTSDQVEKFWKTVSWSLANPIQAGIFYKNETEHIIELPGTEQRIRAKTCWNADTLRGDYADLLILDEYQLMNEDAWGRVGAPMLLDNDGDAMFIYTPLSLRSRSTSKAKDPQHAAKMFKYAQANPGRWAAFHFTSHENPYISDVALDEITRDMTTLAYRMEILAEDVDEAPGAMWKREIIDKHRVLKLPDVIARIVVGVDPSESTLGNEAGIVVGASTPNGHYYIISDDSLQGSPLRWATEVVAAYHRFGAGAIIAEANSGGEMVSQTILTVDSQVNVKIIYASKGKAARAEPIAALYEKGFIHHVGIFEQLEDEMCLWTPGDASPNRMDALVWALTELALLGSGSWRDVEGLGKVADFESPWR